MNIRILTTAVLTAALAISAFAAEIAGKWKTTFTTPNGDKREGVLNLKVDGAKLTGTMESPRGSSEINDGKVDGDNVSFTVVRKFNDNEVTIKYKGKVSGDDMQLTMDFNGNEMQMTAKREK